MRGCVLQRGVVCGMFLWEGAFLLGRDVSSGSRCDLDARGLSLQEVRTYGREHALVKGENCGRMHVLFAGGVNFGGWACLSGKGHVCVGEGVSLKKEVCLSERDVSLQVCPCWRVFAGGMTLWEGCVLNCGGMYFNEGACPLLRCMSFCEEVCT